ncbi:MAG TPA: helicase [Pseudonocardiaceae bacterium]|nr:helicase [Pseudonocardiaceae bacterium]
MTGERAAALRDSSSRSHEYRWQREVAVRDLGTRLGSLRAAENGLCFGRIDGLDGTSYLGRIGLYDAATDDEPLLIDWRAPAARPFYCATAAAPEGIGRRRHFTTRGRKVLDFHDDLLDPAFATTDQEIDDSAASVLFAALDAPRAATMRDIVSTIQAEQDEVIRLPGAGVLVIDGAPGTGKTAVALHRVAYLLYTQRALLSRRGVLVIGPNPRFLSYVGSVLPSLGETDVVFATPGELLPGLRTSVIDTPAAARLKGGAGMVAVLAAAIADRQELPAEPIPIELDDVTVHLDRAIAEPARAFARASGLLPNQAREVFRQQVCEGLVRRAVNRIGAGWLLPGDSAQLRADLSTDVRAELAGHEGLGVAVERLWPVLTSQRLLGDLFSSPARLAALGELLSEADRATLLRPVDAPWTVSDVPLLDEAVELLGPASSADFAAEREAEELAEYTEGVLTILDTDEDPDQEMLRAVDLLDADTLAERHAEIDYRDLAERAAADREWTYGHLVVDEAQELSEMDWRVLLRRCPVRSMTVVGDLAQRQAPAGVRDWARLFGPVSQGRWAYRELTVNYRTSTEIMALAAEVLAVLDPTLRPPTSVRSTGHAPCFREVTETDLAATIEEFVGEQLAELGGGRAAVIAPAELTLSVTVPRYTPRQSKGLEFDVVVIAEPQRILPDQATAGLDDEPDLRRTRAAELYVALTRATQRLGIVHTGPLPAVLCNRAKPVGVQWT